MPETLTLADGGEMSTDEANRLFAEAMAAPEPDEPVAPAPKPRERVKPSEEKPAHSKPRVSSDRPSRGGRKPAAKAEAPKPKDFTAELEGLLQLAYGACAATGNLADAGAIKTHGPGMAQAWNAVAQENASVRAGLEWLTKGGVWGAVIVTTMPFALQVAANHRQIAVEKVAALGVKDPEVLAHETEQDIMQMAQMAQAAA